MMRSRRCGRRGVSSVGQRYDGSSTRRPGILRTRRIVWLLLFAAPAGLAQQGSAPTLRATTSLVVVPTLVRGADGEIAYTLTANDFVLTDNGVAQRVTLEETTGQPLSLVVLMQTGGFARTEFPAYRNLDTMVESLVGTAPHRVAVVSFDSQPALVAPFSADLEAQAKMLDHPQPGDEGAALLDGLAFALDLLKQEAPGARHAILLISQPQDEGSTTKLEAIVRAVGETDTAIYSLTFSPERQQLKDALALKGGHANKPLSVGGCVACVAYFDLGAPLALAYKAMQTNAAAEVAALSGGEVFPFDNKHSLEADLGVLTNHLANRYTLSFRPTSGSPGFHALRVGIRNQPGLAVQARTSYWLAEAGSHPQ